MVIIIEDPFACDFNERTAAPIPLPVPGSSSHHQQEVDEGEAELGVVLDCANIGWSFGKTDFSTEGLEISLRFFKSLDIHVAGNNQQVNNCVRNTSSVNVVGFLPASYIRRRPSDGSRGNAKMETDDLSRLDALVSTYDITLVPPGSDDDQFILAYAWKHKYYVVSNDFYTDHVVSLEDPAQREEARYWLSFYRCSYAFAGADFMLNPRSPFFAELRARRITVPMEVSFEDAPHVNREPQSLIEQLSRCIETMRAAPEEHSVELRHALIARATALLRANLRRSAAEDLRASIALDPANAFEAEMMLRSIVRTAAP